MQLIFKRGFVVNLKLNLSHIKPIIVFMFGELCVVAVESCRIHLFLTEIQYTSLTQWNWFFPLRPVIFVYSSIVIAVIFMMIAVGCFITVRFLRSHFVVLHFITLTIVGIVLWHSWLFLLNKCVVFRGGVVICISSTSILELKTRPRDEYANFIVPKLHVDENLILWNWSTLFIMPANRTQPK